jgi:hypothetical protein
MNGENLDNGLNEEVPEGVEAPEGITEPNPHEAQRTAKREAFIPRERFDEVTTELRELRQFMHQKTLLELQQAERRAQEDAERRDREEEEQYDPTVVKYVGPYLKRELAKALNPLVGTLTHVQQNQVEQAKLDFVAQRLPDLDDLKTDMAAILRAMPESEREEHFSDPRRMVSLGTQVRYAREFYGKGSSRSMTAQERGAMRSLGTTETNGANSRPQLGNDLTNVDAYKLSDDAWQAARKKLGWA